MPSFLNKVFGYKKHDDKDPARATRDASDNTLLDGKYEAISPILSPATATFSEAQSPRDSDRDGAFSFFKSRSRGFPQKHAQKHPEAVPHLTLQLPISKGNSNSRTLSAVFEADPTSQAILDDAVIAAKRLNPLEALMLVRACAQAITERGVETLGIMHPHWFSASPDVQRKLISLFIRSLNPETRKTTLSPTNSSPVSDFETELRYTRSPHDVAAVLRWGLRHLALEDSRFGKDSAEWAWYNSFFHAERGASYPPKAFSELLLPHLPSSHIELLTATLGLISSLASHAETNGISGSKLSKFLGLWLLLATRAEQTDDWNQFYARWDRAGRILEHLFLARLREESFAQRLPTRLQELVKHYPYNKGSPATADDLLFRPRFSTRRYDALFVRVETLLTHKAGRPKQNLVQLLLEAFQLPVDSSSGDECMVLWNTLKATAFEEATSSDSEGPQFSRIFVDETIRLLSLVPSDNSAPTSPGLLSPPISRVISRKRSSSLSKVRENTIPKSGASSESTPISPISPSSPVIADWTQFSLSGFGDTATTQPLSILPDKDDDVEVSQPTISRRSSRYRGKSRIRRQRSEDQEPLNTSPSQSEREPSIVETKLGSIHVVQVDEAFVDFWSDAIVDPISANWPTFVVCGLKETPSAQQPIRWLVVEQAYSHQQSRTPSPDARRGRSPRPSFKSDISGFRINTVFSSARKRFSVFSKSVTDLDLKKLGGKNPITGELGEILVEEESSVASAPLRMDHHVNGNAPVAAVVASGVVALADVADQVNADKISTTPVTAAPPADLISTSKSDATQVTVEAPSVEPTPQSGGGFNSSSEVPRCLVEEAVFVEPGSSSTYDAVNPKVGDTTGPVAEIMPLTADIPHHLCSTQEEHSAVQAEDQPIELVTPPADFTSGPSDVIQADVDHPREDTEAVATTLAPPLDTVQVAVATPVTPLTPVNDEVPESAADGLHVVEEISQKASADLVGASTVESAGQQETTDDLASESTVDIWDKINIVGATGAQVEPDSTTSVIDGVEEATEVSEIPTPAPELATLVDETPIAEVTVYACAAETVVEDSAPQAMAEESQIISEACATKPLEPSSRVVIDPAVNNSDQAVTDGTREIANQVHDQEVQAVVQDTTIIQASEGDVPVGTVSVEQESGEVEAQAQTATESLVLEAPMLAAEHAALNNEIPSPENAAEANEPVEDVSTTAPKSGTVEARTAEPEVEAVVEDAQLPALADVQPVEVLSTESIPEAATAPSTAVDEIAVVMADAQLTRDAAAEDPAPESLPIEEVTVDAPTQFTPTSTDAEVVENKATELTTEEVQVHGEHVVPSENEPVATTDSVKFEDPVGQDAHAPATGTEESSDELGPQSVDEATGLPIVAASAPEGDLTAVRAQVQLEHEAVHPDALSGSQAATEDAEASPPVASKVRETVDEAWDDVDASDPTTHDTEPEIAVVGASVPVGEDVAASASVETEEPSPDVAEVVQQDVTPAVVTDEASEKDGPQADVPAEPYVTSEAEVDVPSGHESAGPSEETTSDPMEA